MYIWILTFTFLYSIFGIEFGEGVDENPYLNYVFEQFNFVFYNTLGEIQPPKYTVWEDKFKNEKTAGSVFIFTPERFIIILSTVFQIT